MGERISAVGEVIANHRRAEALAVGEIRVILELSGREIFEKLSAPVVTAGLNGVFLDSDDLFIDLGNKPVDHRITHIYVEEHVILRPDGRLSLLKVVGEPDNDGDWEYEAEDKGELSPEEYLKFAPLAAQTLERLLLEGTTPRA